MILYEYPFNERIRTYLRLEQLMLRLGTLIARSDPVDHHFALVSLFEIIDVAARADLKADVLKDIERQKSTLESYRSIPSIQQSVLNEVIEKLERCFTALNAMSGKTGQVLQENDWLCSIRARLGIPGGTCSFDLPGYHAWLNQDPRQRHQDLNDWVQSLAPLAESITLLLHLLRENGSTQKVAAERGHFSLYLPAGRSFQLLRLAFDRKGGHIPEISANRLVVTARMLRMQAQGLPTPCQDDVSFEMTLCA